jgi:hypothetical protein
MTLEEEQRRLDSYERSCPVCSDCQDHITCDDYYYEINGRILCERCLRQYRRSVEQFIEEHRR